MAVIFTQDAFCNGSSTAKSILTIVAVLQRLYMLLFHALQTFVLIPFAGFADEVCICHRVFEKGLLLAHESFLSQLRSNENC